MELNETYVLNVLGDIFEKLEKIDLNKVLEIKKNKIESKNSVLNDSTILDSIR